LFFLLQFYVYIAFKDGLLRVSHCLNARLLKDPKAYFKVLQFPPQHGQGLLVDFDSALLPKDKRLYLA
jgi:hypothetical protein